MQLGIVRVAGLWETARAVGCGVWETGKLILLLVALLVADMVALHLLTNLCFAQAVESALAWFFGNGSITQSAPIAQNACLMFAALLGYISIGLIVHIVSQGVKGRLRLVEATEDGNSVSGS